jgi:glycosyltransferase involved in cell wall biosynthesis
MQQLSIVIITFNEEKNIFRCLDSIKGLTDDVIVVDSFSIDKTAEICSAFNVNFIQRKWEGYSSTKNFANSQAKHDWVLSLDADEVLSKELYAIIHQLKENNELSYFSFNRMTNYCGSWVKHSNWYPDIKLRLFNKNLSDWKGLIHEELSIPKGTTIKHINQDILHYSYYTREDHLKQIDKFTSIAADDLFKKGKKPGAYRLVVNAIAKFIGHYFLHLGFLDGKAGWNIAWLSAYATYLKYKKTRCLFKHAAKV